jgi:hypothetical protein
LPTRKDVKVRLMSVSDTFNSAAKTLRAGKYMLEDTGEKKAAAEMQTTIKILDPLLKAE